MAEIDTDEQLLHCYFSYLIFLYSKKSKDDREFESLNVDKLAEHFMNAIRVDKTSKYAKLLRKNAEKCPKWNLLLNKIKFFYFAGNDINLNNLDDIDMDST